VEISPNNLSRMKEEIIREVARTPKVIISVKNSLDELLGLYLYASEDLKRSIKEILAINLKLRGLREFHSTL
jgi:hypothetical protein